MYVVIGSLRKFSMDLGLNDIETNEEILYMYVAVLDKNYFKEVGSCYQTY